MRWPEATSEPLSHLRVRTRAIILVKDEMTGLPPAAPPSMRIQRLDERDAVELGWHSTVTVGGAVVFSGHMDVGDTPREESYRLIVEADAALRPERPGGYEFTVGADPDTWPFQLEVHLLAGPGYHIHPGCQSSTDA